jgi:hypothetical protein
VKLRIGIAISIAAICVLALASYFNPYYVSQDTKRKAQWYDRFCSATRDAVRADRRAFETGTPAERERALAQFWSSTVIYHNSESLTMCLDDLLPDIPACLIAKDWPCAAAFAHALEQTLPHGDSP